MNLFVEIIEKVNSAVWGTPTLMLIIATGIYYTVSLGFFQFSKLPLWLSNTLFAIFREKETRKKDGEKTAFSQFQAMATSLAATVGTGNIAGVGTAISAGGPGAVFWMWFCSFFSMMTSYAENSLGIYYRKRDKNGEWLGGPMYYLKDGLSKKGGAFLAAAFSFFTLFASFGIGNMTQSNSIAAALSSSFGFSKAAVGIVVFALSLFVILGGSSRIGALTEKLVPFMALFYIGASFCIIIFNFSQIGNIFSAIFKSAFSFRAAVGGFSGAAVKKAVSVGFRRGVFSNEAGLGSTVMVGSSSNIKEPAVQGMWGIFQVFVDTIIICSVTAFVLLSVSVQTVPISKAMSDAGRKSCYVSLLPKDDGKKVRLCGEKENRVFGFENGKILKTDETTFINVIMLKKSENGAEFEKIEGASLVSLAFYTVFGKWADIILSLSVTMFAFSTIIGWSFYGDKSVRFLFKGKGKTIYKILFALLTFLGAVTKLDLVWNISDIFNGLMAIPNLIGIIFLSKDVFKITENYLSRRKGKVVSPLLNVHDI